MQFDGSNLSNPSRFLRKENPENPLKSRLSGHLKSGDGGT
jgi:hypothetical protein